jgi:hypothetical protein
MIWAIDLDTLDHQALEAVLGGLGKFAIQNGDIPGRSLGDLNPAAGNGCIWSGMLHPVLSLQLNINPFRVRRVLSSRNDVWGSFSMVCRWP